jgi:hypothetical protein
MAIEDAVRAIVDVEMEKRLRPLREAMQQVANAAVAFASAAGGQSVRRGRPPSISRSAAPKTAGRRGRRSTQGKRACAIIGCGRDARSKGYCSAHYQKRRNLQKKRHPAAAAWKDNAPPNSVADVKLPRGRAATKRAA